MIPNPVFGFLNDEVYNYKTICQVIEAYRIVKLNTKQYLFITYNLQACVKIKQTYQPVKERRRRRASNHNQ